MRIDVVIPTYNRCDQLSSSVDSFVRADKPHGCRVRLIVVDNNSTDRTCDVISAYRKEHGSFVVYLFEPQQGRHHALNCGIAFSDADVVAMYDDDERIDANWLCTVARVFADPAIDYIGGPVLPDWRARPPCWLPKCGYGGVLGIIDHGTTRRQYGTELEAMLTGGNVAIRREILAKCGPYNAEYTYAEDRYMYQRLQEIGATGYYVPEFVVHHSIPDKRLTKSYFRHWAYTEGRNRGKMAADGIDRLPAFFGLPRFMWGTAARSLTISAVGAVFGSHDEASRFKAELDLCQTFGFYLGRNFRFLRNKYSDRS